MRIDFTMTDEGVRKWLSDDERDLFDAFERGEQPLLVGRTLRKLAEARCVLVALEVYDALECSVCGARATWNGQDMAIDEHDEGCIFVGMPRP